MMATVMVMNPINWDSKKCKYTTSCTDRRRRRRRQWWTFASHCSSCLWPEIVVKPINLECAHSSAMSVLLVDVVVVVVVVVVFSLLLFASQKLLWSFTCAALGGASSLKDNHRPGSLASTAQIRLQDFQRAFSCVAPPELYRVSLALSRSSEVCGFPWRSRIFSPFGGYFFCQTQSKPTMMCPLGRGPPPPPPPEGNGRESSNRSAYNRGQA